MAKKELPKAPFFLFDLDKVITGENNTTPNDLLKQTYFSKEDQKSTHLDKNMDRKLRDMLKTASVKEVLAYLKTLSPSGIELEFISLASFDFKEESNHLELMLNTFLKLVETNSDCDFVQALLNNFLKNHHELITESESLTKIMLQIKESLTQNFEKLEVLMHTNLCMTQYFAGLN